MLSEPAFGTAVQKLHPPMRVLLALVCMGDVASVQEAWLREWTRIGLRLQSQ